MTDQPTMASLAAQVDQLTAEVTAFRNQPSLRHCIYPGCLREFDMAARMEGREPARPSWSGDGWHQTTRGVASGSICPDHVDIITAHMARPVDLPNGRWMVACACDWMSRPQTYGGLLKPLWAVLIGFDDDTLTAVAARHDWNEHRVKYVREMRALLAPVTDPQQPKEQG